MKATLLLPLLRLLSMYIFAAPIATNDMMMTLLFLQHNEVNWYGSKTTTLVVDFGWCCCCRCCALCCVFSSCLHEPKRNESWSFDWFAFFTHSTELSKFSPLTARSNSRFYKQPKHKWCERAPQTWKCDGYVYMCIVRDVVQYRLFLACEYRSRCPRFL